eukprot:3382789-Rhodomonas_salina.1
MVYDAGRKHRLLGEPPGLRPRLLLLLLSPYLPTHVLRGVRYWHIAYAARWLSTTAQCQVLTQRLATAVLVRAAVHCEIKYGKLHSWRAAVSYTHLTLPTICSV